MAPPAITFATSLSPWNVTAEEYLQQHDPSKTIDGLAAASVVFDPSGNRILLIQRAATDTMPNRWEVPGGAVDDDDKTILHAAARELFEEAGLTAVRFTHVVTSGPGTEPAYLFSGRNGTRMWCRFAFIAEVQSCEGVVLNASEHQEFLWATEEEVRGQRVGERDLPITTENMRAVVLEAFRLRREAGKGS